MKIGLASDHAGFTYKERLKEYLSDVFLYKKSNINDYGCNSLDSVDYPDFAHKLASSIENNENNFGIQFCRTGNGVNMTANKHKRVRAALCWKVEIAEQARLHNNANILTMPAGHLSWEEIIKIVNVFLTTEFEGERHKLRVDKI